MIRICLMSAALLAGAADKPAAPPTRAEQVKALRAEFEKSRDKLIADIRAGKLKAKDGAYPDLAALEAESAAKVATLIDADPTDDAALDALLLIVGEIHQWDRRFTDLIALHHAKSPKLGPFIKDHRGYISDPKALKSLAANSPHAEVRGRAAFDLARHHAEKGADAEAEALLERIKNDPALAKLDQHRGSLGQAADDLLFELRHLSVGKEAPDVVGVDLTGKPMKLSEYRGKVVLFAFWSAGCKPCMEMVPHERALVEEYAGRPFAVVGMNGDIRGQFTFAKDKPIDMTARLKALVEKEKITWRSFAGDGWDGPIARRWNVDSWPTVYVLDAQGIIRFKSRGTPEDKDVDPVLDKWVAAAEKK